VPADDLKKIKKASSLGADCVVLDLEDGVAQNRKLEARKTMLEALVQAHDNDADELFRSEVCVRINPISSGFGAEDLEHVCSCIELVDSVVVPKVNHWSDLALVSDHLDAMGSFRARHIRLFAFIETAQGLINVRDICSHAPRLSALVFGSEDFCADMGASRTPDATELLFARSSLVTHARAFKIDAIDMVCVDYKNKERLTKEAEDAARMGFCGKQAIHPSQIAPIYEAFKPAPDVFAWAERIIAADIHHQAQGKGAFSLDGKMIDAPMVKWAQNIIHRNVKA